MKLDKKLTQALILGLGLYVLLTSSLEVSLVTFGIAAIIVGITHQLESAILVLAAPVIIKLVNKVNEPFQIKDAPSIATRLQEVKQAAPLNPKVEPTGVLESPEILNSENLVGMKALASEALPGASIPASAKASVAIYTPEERTVEATGMRVTAPLANPVLQNGPDLDGVLSALKQTGAAAAQGPADMVGVAGNAGNAF
jgi:hypothetical protein